MTTKVSWLVFKHINKYNDSVPGVPVYISPGISSSRTDLHRSFCQLPITEYRTYLPPRSSKLPSLQLLHQYAWATCHDSRGWTLQNQPLSMWIYVVVLGWKRESSSESTTIHLTHHTWHEHQVVGLKLRTYSTSCSKFLVALAASGWPVSGEIIGEIM